MNEINMELRKKILFSEQAHEDGYDFSGLSAREQKLTKEYYTDKVDMLQIYRRIQSADSYIKRDRYDNYALAPYDVGWGFPTSGWYDGIIVNCSPSYKPGCEDYILEIMIEEQEIRYVKFNPFETGIIQDAILDETELTQNPDIQPEHLIGRWVQLEVQNNVYGGNKRFSAIKEFYFLTREIEDLYRKMTEIMFRPIGH